MDESTNTVTTPPEGPGFGAAILNALGRQTQKQRQEEVAKFFSDIQSAGSREKALEVVKNYSGKFRSSNDFTHAFRSVDEFYPEASKEIKTVNVYDKSTGELTPHFVRSSEIESLTNPEEFTRRFGPNATLTKPDLETFYSPEDDKEKVTVLGKFPVSQRPEGAVTLSELQEARRQRIDARNDERFRVSQEQFNQRMALAEAKWAEALGKLGDSAADKDLQRGRQLLNDATRLTALSLNARMLPDGSFTFDDDNRAKLFNDRLRFMTEYVATDPSILKKATGGIDLHTRASKAFPLASDEPKPAAAPTPKPKGALTRLLDKVTGKDDEGKPAAKGTEKKAPTGAELSTQISAKVKEINARTDLTDEQKKGALERLRGIAKQNNVKVNF